MSQPWELNEHGLWCPACGEHIAAPWNMDDDYQPPETCKTCGFPDFEDGAGVFVWRDYIDDTIPKQEGIECALFRNEGKITSSNLIRQADAIADHAWPSQRHYTKVDPEEVRSGYPGWCFIRAGWKRCGTTQSGKLIFERLP